MLLAHLLAACGPATPTLADSAPEADSATDSAEGEDTGVELDVALYAVEVAVSVHPDVATILVVDWTQLAAVDAAWLTWELDGDTFASPELPRVPDYPREVVLGVPADTAIPLTLHVRVGGDEGALALGTFSTGPLPTDLAAPTLVTWDPLAALDARWFLASVDVGDYAFYGPCYVVLLDRQGRVVWYQLVADRRLTLFPRVARAGTHLAWEASTYYVGPDVLGSLTRSTLDLSQQTETTLENVGFTWDELDDGSILYDYAEDGYQYHLTRLHPDGTSERIWSCWPWMREYRQDYWSCAPNTVLWNPETDRVVWSMFVSGTVVEIDLTTGERVRHFGQVADGWSFDPVDVNFEYQHFPNWTSDGTLIVSTHVPDASGVQVVREFELDDATETVRQVWSWTPDAGHYAQYAGEAQRLANGGTLVNFGTDGVVVELSADGNVAWEIDWHDKLVGHLTPIDDLYALNAGW